METNYNWKFCSVGGVVRVKIESGEDIAHLDELDQKLWTVLSCPVEGLEFDRKTLQLLDTDGDGKIRVSEVVAAAKWLTSVIKDKDLILKGDSSLSLDQIDTDNETGRKLHDSARQILANLGLDKSEISIEDTSDSVAIFSGTKFNGDGIITPTTSDDKDISELIATIADKIGHATDRSGAEGVTADHVDAFFTACSDYSAWQAAAASDASVFPFGADTAAALAACDTLKDKIADYFMRCKLIGFDADVADAVDVSVEKIGAISDRNLATQVEELAAHPLARPGKDAVLPFAGINPAWQPAFDKLKTLVLDADFKGKDGITEAEWQATLAKFGPYTAWLASKKGEQVEALGIDAVNAILKSDRKAELLELVEKDKALAEESASIDAVDKLLHLYRDFFHLLNNYVIFSDFYNTDPTVKAVFDAGELFIDQRCCKLCIRVFDMGKHTDMDTLSGMFLIYCKCSSKSRNETFDIVAVMTDGDVTNLSPGKNGVFYDRQGNDWDAVITKIVDNPISVKQAFWSPYRKLAKFINDKIDKDASEKDSEATADLLAKFDNSDPDKPDQPFDIGKFAGIFAAIGMAVGALGAGLGLIISGLKGLAWWQYFVIIAAILIVISGPACFIAWRKLRKRNLGPVLNANGWAINSVVLINIIFGGTLTSTAKYPKIAIGDPFAKKGMPCWVKWLIGILSAAVVAFGILFFTDNLPWQAKDEACVEPVEELAPECEDAPAEVEETPSPEQE